MARIVGDDDHGHHFDVTFDKVWAANLVVELDEWLSNGDPAQNADDNEQNVSSSPLGEESVRRAGGGGSVPPPDPHAYSIHMASQNRNTVKSWFDRINGAQSADG